MAGGADTSIEKRVQLDLKYIENWSFFLDMKIVWFTVFGKKNFKNPIGESEGPQPKIEVRKNVPKRTQNNRSI